MNRNKMLLTMKILSVMMLAILFSFSVFQQRAGATEVADAVQENTEVNADQNVVVDGITYRFVDEKQNALLITSLPETTDKTFTVPATADGYPVLGFDTEVICDCEHWNDIEYLEFAEGITEIADYSCLGMPSLKAVVLPDTVTTIGSAAFADCLDLESITLPSGLKTVGDDAFANCFSLKEISLPKGLKKIGDYAFSGAGLVELVLPNTVTSLGKYAFYGCQDLTSLTFSSKLKTIPAGVAKYCTSLKEVSLPSKAESIGKEAFYNCSSLKTVQIPNRVKTVYTYAFANCYSLDRVSVGRSVTKITASAFVGSELISKLIFKGTEPPTMAKSLYLPENTLIRVPEGLLEAYQEVLKSNTYVRRYKLQMNEYK